MKNLQTDNPLTVDGIAEYIILITASVSLAFSVCLICLWQDTISANLPYMATAGAVFLFLPCFFKKAAKSAAIIGGALLFVFAVFIQIKYNAVFNLITAFLSASDYIITRQNASIRVFVCIISVLCCLLMFFAVKSRAGILLTSIAGVTLVFLLSAFDCGYSLPVLLVFMGCCAVLFLRRTAILSAWRGGLKARGMGRFTAVAAAGCAAALIFSQLSFTFLKSAFGDKQQIDIANIAGNISNIINSQPSKTGFGDYNPAEKLGGKISYDDTTVLEVETNEPFYLRGRIYDTYTGKNWRATISGNKGDIYGQSVSKRAPGYSEYLLGLLDSQRDDLNWIFDENFYRYSYLLNLRILTVKVKTDGQKYLFVPANYYSVNLSDKQQKVERYYPDLCVNSPLGAESVYSISYYSLDMSSEEFKNAEKNCASDYKALLADTRISDAMKEYAEYNKQIRKAYMGTDKVTQRTKELALSITKNCKNEFEKADAIKSWLQKNCTYTLTPNQPFFGRDFVDYFLFGSHAGYCEHFATAMTVMLRAAGVPARYVEGYAAPSVSKAGTYEVTNRQAHAWVEYYSDMYGFLTADPTPASSLPTAYTSEEVARMEAAMLAQTASIPSGFIPSSSQSLSGTSQSESSLPEDESSLAADSETRGLASLKKLLLSALSGIAALLLILYGGKAAFRAVRFIIVSHRPRKEQVIRLYAYFAAALSRLGFERPPSATPNEFADTVRGRMKFGAADFDKVTGIYVAARFGEREIRDDEINAVRDFYHGFLKYCRNYTGTAAFILKYPLL